MMQWPRPRREQDTDETYQLDAVVSLFAMILLILVTTAAAISSGITNLDYDREDPDSERFRLASLGVPFARLETWVLYDSVLARIDYDTIAQTLAEASDGVSRQSTDDATDVLVTFRASDTALGAYTALQVFMPEVMPKQAGGFISEIIDPASPDGLQEWSSRSAPARIIAFPDNREYLPDILTHAEDAGRPVTVVFHDDKEAYSAKRDETTFTFRGVLRVQ